MPPSPRALPAEAIVQVAGQAGLRAEESGDVVDAVTRALQIAGDDDLVLVTGSLYVVGAARGFLRSIV